VVNITGLSGQHHQNKKYISELYPESHWAAEMKALIAAALELKKQLTHS
jgi:hypothetical protein